jgi:glycogen synthase
MLTWEYPPRIVGGISRVVEGLSRALVTLGAEAHVITAEMPGSPLEEDDQGVYVHRVKIESPAPSFQAWVLLMNHYFAKRAGKLAGEVGSFDIVHVHDWLVHPCGAEVKSFLGSTLVSTLHSLEYRRSGNSTAPESQMVESLEWWVTYESKLVTVCSESMKRDTKWKYNVPEDKIVVIPNGVNLSKYESVKVNKHQARAKWGVNGSEKLLLFVGRLTHQKGVEYLIRAIPSVAKSHNVRLIVVGDGYMRGQLESEANATGQGWRMRFTGFISDSDVVELLLSSDVMVIPSVYEPFGVVALEAMASSLPVVASNVDGLAEIVEDEETGILVKPRDSASISGGISKILSDPVNAKRMVANARAEVSKRYTWDAIANSVLKTYRDALA